MNNFDDRVLKVVAPLLQSEDKHDGGETIAKKLDHLLNFSSDIKNEEIDILNKIKVLLKKGEKENDDEDVKDRLRKLKDALEDPEFKDLINDTFNPRNQEYLRDLRRDLFKYNLREGIDDTREATDDLADRLQDGINSLLLGVIAASQLPEILRLKTSTSGMLNQLLRNLVPWFGTDVIGIPEDSNFKRFVERIQNCCDTANTNMGAYYTLLHDEISSINPDPDAIRRIESRLEDLRGLLQR